MRESVEDAIAQMFPEVWSQRDVDNFLDSARFSRDNTALDQALNKPIRDFLLRGGKRIRPVLFLTLLKSFGEEPSKYMSLALLIEMVHNGTLVIDDIEDRAEIRRGKPALHKAFDMDIAINTGVAMHLLFSKAINDKNVSEQQQLRLFRVFSEEIMNVYAGQAIDIYWHKNIPRDIEVEQYFEMARLKTGALMRMAVRFACVLTEQQENVEKALINFAELAAIAFQVKDDVLDITGEQKEFGKAIGGDITEGKVSLPVVLAIRKLSGEEQDRLCDILLSHTRESADIKEAQSLIIQTDATEDAMSHARGLLEESWQGVEQHVPSGEGRDFLQELAQSFINRKQ